MTGRGNVGTGEPGTTAAATPTVAAGPDSGGDPPGDVGADGAWIAVATADSVTPGEVVESALDGTDVVVWRTAGGVPCVMEARCPHQWSHLGDAGAVAGEEIVCLTHFWTFATDGSGWKENLDGRRDRKGDIEVYPCREAGGTIWARQDPAGRTP